ncbi:MAG TPA: NUDIX domain-containing protein [Bacteroidales bacterium]|nr:NUDIX domain-containing protein [Bacteroidales bacterium]
MINNRYQFHDKNYVAVDSIIFGFNSDNVLMLLLIKRKFEPCKGCYSLMGGFVRKDEGLDNAACRILDELTGLKSIYLEQLYTYGDLNRDTEARVISVAYYALIKMEDYDEELGQRYDAQWFPIDKLPPLIFDHETMVEKAIRRLRRKTIIQPIGFELLPEKFTMFQLQKLYESIHHQNFDKRNFRKKILSMNVLTMLNEKDKIGSKRGAALFKFDKDKYDHLMENGYSMQFV